jgi:hypothetical protein
MEEACQLDLFNEGVNMLWALVVVLLLLAVFGMPTWPYAADWGVGYWPSGVLFVLLIVVLISALGSRGRLRGPTI